MAFVNVRICAVCHTSDARTMSGERYCNVCAPRPNPRLRATVTFTDGCAPAVEHWPDCINDYDQAKFWAQCVRGAHLGASYEIEAECPKHGWEVVVFCTGCGDFICEKSGQETQCIDCEEDAADWRIECERRERSAARPL